MTLDAGQPSRKRPRQVALALLSRIDKAENMGVDALQYITAMSAATIHRQKL